VTDEDFYDSGGSSGVTWDTTDQDIIIDASGVLLSDLVSKGISYDFVTMSFGDLDVASGLITGLLNYYKCDELAGSSSLSDSVGSRVGTAVSNVDFAAGKIGNAITCSVQDYFSFSTGFSDDVKSIAFWAFNDTLLTGSSISKGPGGDNSNATGVYFGSCTGNLTNEIVSLFFNSSSQCCGWSTSVIGSTISIGWHFYVFVWSSGDSKWRLYFDGVDKGLADTVNGTQKFFSSGENWDLGRTSAGFDWDGLIDMFGFWNRSLSSSEAGSLYNSGVGVQYPFGGDVEDYTLEVSADNKGSWQTISRNVRTALSSSTSDGLFYRITAGSNVVTLNNAYNSLGLYSASAIKMILEES
jgi:hypothetical protein